MNLPKPNLPAPGAAPATTQPVVPEQPAHAERAHAKVSSSKMHRLAHCIWSVQEGLDLPPETTSEAAKTGTLYHEVIEMRTKDFLNHRQKGTDPDASLMAIVRNPKYTDEMIVTAAAAVDTIWEHGFDRTITGKFWDTETKFTLMPAPNEVSGIPDFWCAYINDKGEKEGYIWDYKNGVHDVQAKNNWQGKFLAACMQEIMGKKRPFDRIRFAIYQPNSMAGGDAYKETSFTAKQIETAKIKILQVAKKVYEPELKKDGTPKAIKPKEGSGCKWCPARSICPAQKAKLRAVTVMAPKSDVITIPDIATLTPEVRRKILENKAAIEEFLKSVYEAEHAQAMQGQCMEGFKLVKGKSQRRINTDLDVDIAIQKLEAMGAKDVYTKKLKGVGVLEKQIGKENLEQFIKRTQPSIALVPVTDKREAYDPIATVRGAAAAQPLPAPVAETNGTTKPVAKSKAKGAVKTKPKAKRKTVQRKK